MKNLSIKMKVTLWYTGLVVMIMLLVLAFVLTSADKVLLFKMEDTIENVVKDSVEELDYSNGKLEVEEDFEYYDDGVNIVIYNEQGALLEGRNPADFNASTPFKSNQIQTIQNGNQEWLVFDTRWDAGDNDVFWVRGISPLNQLSTAMNSIIIVTLIAIPFFVLIAGVGGYFITRIAFRPVQKIIDSANRISDAKDLSERIHLQGSHDEIYALAQTFDNMFERLQHSFESEKQFTSDASHELRTPTSVIISQCEYALTQSDNPEEVKDSLEVVLKQARKMSALISQLLLLARADNKKENIVFEQINISELSEMVIEELSPMAENAGIALTKAIQPDLMMRADQTLMTRLLMNLFTNGITYGKPGGYVHLELTQQGNRIVGKVSDDGIGIDHQHQSKIWDRFYRVDSSRTSDQRGNIGLGLSMVKWIVEVQKGTISVESELGKGSTFTFTLPIGVN